MSEKLGLAVDRERLFAIVTTCGTTNAGVIDDLQGAADVAERLGVWFHVDGAYGGAGLAAPSVRSRYAGIERADSYIVDPHTACGFAELAQDRPSVVLATASPAKFPDTIVSAIGIEPKDPSLEALKSRPVQKYLLKTDATSIRGFIEQHAV